MLDFSKYKAVLFDYDDTLVQTIKSKWAQHIETAKTFYNIELTEDTLRKHWAKPYNELVWLLYEGKDSVENMIKNNNSLNHKYKKEWHPGAVELIKKLRSQNVLVGIVTSMYRSYLEWELPLIGMPLDTFFMIQGEDDTQVHKPDPKVFIPILAKLEKLGVGKSQVLYIGDNIRDMQAALGAGLDFIGVLTGVTKKEDFGEGATVVSSLESLLK